MLAQLEETRLLLPPCCRDAEDSVAVVAVNDIDMEHRSSAPGGPSSLI